MSLPGFFCDIVAEHAIYMYSNKPKLCSEGVPLCAWLLHQTLEVMVAFDRNKTSTCFQHENPSNNPIRFKSKPKPLQVGLPTLNPKPQTKTQLRRTSSTARPPGCTPHLARARDSSSFPVGAWNLGPEMLLIILWVSQGFG